MQTDEMVAAAYHEAGHAVVGHCLGAHVNVLRLSAANAEEGSARISVAGLDASKRVLVLLAGTLAEIKHEAIKKWGTGLCFAQEGNCDLVEVAYDRDYILSESPSIYFQTSAGLREFAPPSANIFSDFEDFFCVRHRIDERQFPSLLRDAMAVLDDAASWRAVERTAAALCRTGELSTQQFLDAVRE